MNPSKLTSPSKPPSRSEMDPAALIGALAQWLESVLDNENRGEQLAPGIDCWTDETTVYIEAQALKHDDLHADISFCGDRVVIRLAR
jgi:hypothetical protein